jgi:hypothetical protein
MTSVIRNRMSCSVLVLVMGWMGCSNAASDDDWSAEQGVTTCSVPNYTLKNYVAGERVQNRGSLYECKPYPFSGWCGLSSAYEPGVGWAWQDAWKLIDVCGSGTGGTTGTGGAGSGGSAGKPASGGSGGSSAGSGGTSGGAIVGSLYQHCAYGGWKTDLRVGKYRRSDLLALGALDNDASSLKLSPGYEAVLYDLDNFTGTAVVVSGESDCLVGRAFNDRLTSLEIRAAGTGTGGTTGSGGSGGSGTGGSGTGGSGGSSGFGPTSCQPAFEQACKPNITFINDDPAGAKNFTDVITDPVATMKQTACTVCSILFRSPNDIPTNRRHTTIELRVANVSGVAFAGGNRITIATNHIKNFSGNRARTEFNGVLAHEMVHLYQHYGNGGTGEGLADCVRIRVGLYEQGRCNRGGSWKDAYTTSGCFYSWLTGPGPYHTWSHDKHDLDFPFKLNKALAGTSGDAAYTAVANLVQQQFGQSVDSLWAQYQADL